MHTCSVQVAAALKDIAFDFQFVGHLYAAVTLGFAVNYACTPLFFELGSELAYPVGEGVVAGLMTCGWCVVGILYLSVFFVPNVGKFLLWSTYCTSPMGASRRQKQNK